mmetsp:Transcript_63354/g.196106  ORF Transcript_63354/g.196106 Transcript_63354/m.196106 type:complete len:211 (+) Transcript_63354:372-1004(+)
MLKHDGEVEGAAAVELAANKHIEEYQPPDTHGVDESSKEAKPIGGVNPILDRQEEVMRASGLAERQIDDRPLGSRSCVLQHLSQTPLTNNDEATGRLALESRLNDLGHEPGLCATMHSCGCRLPVNDAWPRWQRAPCRGWRREKPLTGGGAGHRNGVEPQPEAHKLRTEPQVGQGPGKDAAADDEECSACRRPRHIDPPAAAGRGRTGPR